MIKSHEIAKINYPVQHLVCGLTLTVMGTIFNLSHPLFHEPCLAANPGGYEETFRLAQTDPVIQTNPTPILFRTKRYVIEIIWRRGQPYLSVSNNGFRVIANVPARTASARGVNDQWTAYTANSADYTAIVRIGPTGEGMIEVRQVGQRIVQEYATSSLLQQPTRPAIDQRNATLLSFQTGEYAVHVYRKQQDLYMNLFNKNKGATELKQVPVTKVESSEGTIYRYDGAATVQAREDYRGQRVLLILQNNAVQYRGDGY